MEVLINERILEHDSTRLYRHWRLARLLPRRLGWIALRSGSVLRTAVIFFYISNEGVSILENAARLGLPVPEKIKVVLEQLHDRSTKDGE